LYLVYDEAMIREATDNMEAGISVGGRIIDTIRYAHHRAGKTRLTVRNYFNN